MGQYFVMSKRLNKRLASDFGLVDLGNGVALNPIDGSFWKKELLFALGWGCENGYYRIPLPDFIHLIRIIIANSSDEDVFGAAAIIMQQHPEELLEYCENLILDPKRIEEFGKISYVLKLDHLRNRSPILNKSMQEITADFERWKRISLYAIDLKCRSHK